MKLNVLAYVLKRIARAGVTLTPRETERLVKGFKTDLRMNGSECAKLGLQFALEQYQMDQTR